MHFKIFAIAFVGCVILNSPYKTFTKVPLRDYEIRLSYYTPLACPLQVVCMQGDGDHRYADGTPVTEETLGTVGACPPELFGATITIPSLDLTIKCLDNFGTLEGVPVVTKDNVHHVFLVDVSWPEGSPPQWNQWVMTEWRISWH